MINNQDGYAQRLRSMNEFDPNYRRGSSQSGQSGPSSASDHSKFSQISRGHQIETIKESFEQEFLVSQ
jgi:hypothetical protein